MMGFTFISVRDCINHTHTLAGHERIVRTHHDSTHDK